MWLQINGTFYLWDMSNLSNRIFVKTVPANFRDAFGRSISDSQKMRIKRDENRWNI